MILNFFLFRGFRRIEMDITKWLRSFQGDGTLLPMDDGFAARIGVIERDAVKPCGKIRLTAEASDGAVSRKKGFLSRFRGFIIVVQHSVYQIENRFLMPEY
jgi:hypothetical protein